MPRKCRYLEANELIYSSVGFMLMHIESINRFLTIVPQGCLNNIQILHLSWAIAVPLYMRDDQVIEDRNKPSTPRERRKLRASADEAERMWENSCRVISTMKRLIKLRIRFQDFLMHYVSEEALLAPLMGVHVDDFVVHLPFHRTGSEVISGPFRIERSNHESLSRGVYTHNPYGRWQRRLDMLRH